MSNTTLIESVLGFDLNAEIKSNDGQVIRTGIRKTCIACQDEYASVGTKLVTKHWFTHYNQALLDKIRDMRRNID